MLGQVAGTMKPDYDVVVVGSGYGGAIAASRFARAGKTVCLLERGSERWPGEFPETFTQAAREMQISTAKRRVGSPLALFDMRFDDEVNVLVGCGLGGTSLINANVALRPIPEVFDDDRWPAAVRGPNKHELDRYFNRAEEWLGSNRYPPDAPLLPKLSALGTVAESLGAPIERAPINVTFTRRRNAAGVEQPACNFCGNCVSGCNVGAKNTVLMNYLPDAVAHGAEIFTECSVGWVQPGTTDVGQWEVSYTTIGAGRHLFDAPEQIVRADIVVLAAGTLGSTEIMLRSRERGLATSDRLGERFNGNGDVLGFGYNSDRDLNAIGWARGESGQPVGPTITGVVPTAVPSDDGPIGLGEDDLVIEEGAIPGVLRRVLPLTLLYTAITAGNSSFKAKLKMLMGSWRQAARHTLTYLVMSNDQGNGRLVLDDDRLTLDWPQGPTDPHIRRNNALLAKVSPAIGAQYAPEMWWTESMGHQLITVHPLGGCVMGDTAETGVVNDRCEVFAGTTDDSVHPGLHVMDGAVLPRPVDTNPSLTISALVERAVEEVIASRGWTLNLETTSKPLSITQRVRSVGNGVRFTERMAGHVSFGPGASHEDTWAEAQVRCERGAKKGEAEGSPVSFVVTVQIDDVDTLQQDPGAVQSFTGTVQAPALSDAPLTISDGEFQLLRRVPEAAEAWQMVYRMTLTAIDGRRFFFEGFKSVKTGSMVRGWKDTTTLFVTITSADDGDDAASRDGVGETVAPGVVGSGVLRISVPDLLRQLSTIDAPGANIRQRIRRTWRFARAFTGAFLPVYGGLFAEERRADHQPFTGLRSLRLPEPSATIFHKHVGWQPVAATDIAAVALTAPQHLARYGTPILDVAGDDAELMLTRFRGGDKGPVLLAAGFSMRANSFAEPTTTTTMAEALAADGFDVWLFDYRASIALPSSRTEFTIDDVAKHDWPQAVAEVRRITGAESVQVVGHCVGSVSILMALLSGLEGVRSAVCSQFPMHPETSALNRFKNAMHVVDLFQAVGIRTLEPSTGRRWKDRITDLGAGVLPIPKGERCQVPMCRWLNAIFGLTHTHDQLNAATHESFTAAFGAGEIKPLRHLSMMLRKGVAVDAHGNDTYTQHVEKLDLPLLFLQGSKNYIFKPKGMGRTLRWIRAEHGPETTELLYLDGYAHLDGIVGSNAHVDVYPAVIEHLNRY